MTDIAGLVQGAHEGQVCMSLKIGNIPISYLLQCAFFSSSYLTDFDCFINAAIRINGHNELTCSF